MTGIIWGLLDRVPLILGLWLEWGAAADPFPWLGIVGAPISWHQHGCGDACLCSFVTVLLMLCGADDTALSTTEPQLWGTSISPAGLLSIGYVVFSLAFSYLLVQRNLLPRA